MASMCSSCAMRLRLLSQKRFEEVLSLFTQVAEQVLDLLHRQRRRFGAAVLPTIYGGEGDAELDGEFFLSKPGPFPEFAD
jgi:hypothetical protein